MKIVIYFLWIIINALLLNIAFKLGWDHDPGYIGPIIIVFVINLTAGLYSTRIRSES